MATSSAVTQEMPKIPLDIVQTILDHFNITQNKIDRDANCAVAIPNLFPDASGDKAQIEEDQWSELRREIAVLLAQAQAVNQVREIKIKLQVAVDKLSNCPGTSCRNCGVRTLRACSLVSKAWQPICQGRLFKDVNLPHSSSIHTLVTTLQTSPHLTEHIARLRLGDFDMPSMDLTALWHLPFLDAVHTLTWSVASCADFELLDFLPSVLPNITTLHITPQCTFYEVTDLFDLSRAFSKVATLTFEHLTLYEELSFPPERLPGLASPIDDGYDDERSIPLKSLVIKEACESDSVDLPTLWCARQASLGFRDLRALKFLNIVWLEQPCHMEYLNQLFRSVGGSLEYLKLTLHGPEYDSPFTSTVTMPFPAFDLSHNAALRSLEIRVTKSHFKATALEGPVALIRGIVMLKEVILVLFVYKKVSLDVPDTWRDILQLFTSPQPGKPITLIVITDSTALPAYVHDASRALKGVGVTLHIMSGNEDLLATT